MTSLPQIAKNFKHQIRIVALMLLILLSSILFALQSQPVRHVTPDVVMKRESLEITPEFEEALNVSLKRGYLQGVNWEWVA